MALKEPEIGVVYQIQIPVDFEHLDKDDLPRFREYWDGAFFKVSRLSAITKSPFGHLTDETGQRLDTKHESFIWTEWIRET